MFCTKICINDEKSAADYNSDNYSNYNSSVNRKLDAWICAENVVENRLKAPSSAEFCSYPEAIITKSGDIYTIKGYVDTDNDFGANIRTNFTVTLTLTENGYESDSCVFN